jgi:tRNA1(Val) A37 N6-methylase TrmN6
VTEFTEGTLLGGLVSYRQLATGHRSGFEPVLLAACIPAKPGERVLEAGTGAGAALLCLSTRVPGLTATGIEIDPALAALSSYNFKFNGLSDFFTKNMDIAAFNSEPIFDHVLANPPWHDAGSTVSPDAKRALAHQAGPQLLATWITTLTSALKPRGSISLILPAVAFADAAALLRAQNCGGILLFPLWPRAGQAAKLVIIQARRGSRAAARVLPGLVLHDATGITPEANAVLRDGAAISM